MALSGSKIDGRVDCEDRRESRLGLGSSNLGGTRSSMDALAAPSATLTSRIFRGVGLSDSGVAGRDLSNVGIGRTVEAGVDGVWFVGKRESGDRFELAGP